MKETSHNHKTVIIFAHNYSSTVELLPSLYLISISNKSIIKSIEMSHCYSVQAFIQYHTVCCDVKGVINT